MAEAGDPQTHPLAIDGVVYALAGGQQYVLVQADNARDRKSPQGAAYVAFALPAKVRS
jgi:hypothetical protein